MKRSQEPERHEYQITLILEKMQKSTRRFRIVSLSIALCFTVVPGVYSAVYFVSQTLSPHLAAEPPAPDDGFPVWVSERYPWCVQDSREERRTSHRAVAPPSKDADEHWWKLYCKGVHVRVAKR